MRRVVRGGSFCLLERCEYFLTVLSGGHFVVFEGDLSLFVDHERPSSGCHATDEDHLLAEDVLLDLAAVAKRNSEFVGDVAFDVSKKGVVELVRLLEERLTRHRVATDSEDQNILVDKQLLVVAVTACLLRSATGHRGGVKEQDDVLFANVVS